MSASERDDIIARYLDGDLDDAGIRALLAEVDRDTGAADDLGAARAIDADLRRLLGPSASDKAFVLGIARAFDTHGMGSDEFALSVARQASPSKRSRRVAAPAVKTWIGRGIVAVAAIVVAALTIRTSGSHCPPVDPGLIGRIARTSGDVTVGPGARAAALDMRLRSGDSIRTSEDADASLRLSDGTTIDLEGGTACELSRTPGQGLLAHLQRGAVLVEARPQVRPARFVTPHATIVVIGTVFYISAENASSRIEVTVGVVRVTRTSDAAAVSVPAGHYVVAAPGQELVARPLIDGTAPVATAPAGGPRWKALFEDDALTDWTQVWGAWSCDEGVLAGLDPAGGRCRIESTRDYEDFDIEFEILLDGRKLAEFQVGTYAYFFQIDLKERPAGWHRFAASVRGTDMRASVDGVAVDAWRGIGPKGPPRGTIAFFASRGVMMRIRNARVRERPED